MKRQGQNTLPDITPFKNMDFLKSVLKQHVVNFIRVIKTSTLIKHLVLKSGNLKTTFLAYTLIYQLQHNLENFRSLSIYFYTVVGIWFMWSNHVVRRFVPQKLKSFSTFFFVTISCKNKGSWYSFIYLSQIFG